MKEVMPWKVTFDETLRKRLRKTRDAALDNGESLLGDANILYENGRLPRAGVLAILAEEEIAKALILHLAIIEERWDSDLYSAIRKHEKKHAILHGAICVANNIIRHSRRISTQISPNLIDFKKIAHDSINLTSNSYIKKRQCEESKQRMLYVDVFKDGSCNAPQINSSRDVCILLDRCFKLKTIFSKIFLGENVDDHPFARTDSTVSTSNYIDFKLKHSEGIDIIISYDNILPITEEIDLKKKIRTFFLFESYFYKDRESKFDFFSRDYDDMREMIINHKIVEQILKQKQELGIKQSNFEEYCVSLVERCDVVSQKPKQRASTLVNFS